MFDFPNSPVNGTQATGSGGQVYTYDGTKWVATASAPGVTSWNTRTGAVTLNSADVTTALTFTPYNATNPSGYQTAAQVTTALAPYAPLAAPVFTGDARAVTASPGDSDTSIATTAFVQSAVAPVANNVGRNLVTNGTFAVAQRGAGPWTTSGYTLDRWTVFPLSGDTISFSQTALADSDRAAIGDEAATYQLRNVFTGNAAAAGGIIAQQRIENLRRLANKTVTVSFWANASATLKLGVSIDQYFGTGGSPTAAVNGVGQAVTLSTTWARYSLTFTLASLATTTLGTNGDNSTQLNFWYSSGTTNATRAGSVGVQSGTISIYGCQLEIGTQATPLDAGGSPQQILAECSRFFQTGTYGINGYNSAGGNIGNIFSLLLPMRATPTVVMSNLSYSNSSGATVWTSSTSSVGFYATVTATAAALFSLNWTASADL